MSAILVVILTVMSFSSARTFNLPSFEGLKKPSAGPAPPDVGKNFEASMTFTQNGKVQSTNNVWIASTPDGPDYSLTQQLTPAIGSPYFLNVCNHGIRESYAQFNPANGSCVRDQISPCYDGENCQTHTCTCLFDNPFMGLPFTTKQAKMCGPGLKATTWQVVNGGFTVAYCIQGNTGVSVEISGQGYPTLLYSFSNWKNVVPLNSTFGYPTYCKC